MNAKPATAQHASTPPLTPYIPTPLLIPIRRKCY